MAKDDTVFKAGQSFATLFSIVNRERVAKDHTVQKSRSRKRRNETKSVLSRVKTSNAPRILYSVCAVEIRIQIQIVSKYPLQRRRQ